MKTVSKKWLIVALCAAIGTFGGYVWFSRPQAGPGPGFVSGNGRIEATETGISAKLAGRIARILVEEGDAVQQGQVLAVMQTDVLEAQRNEALAQRQLAVSNEIRAKAQITLRESDKLAAVANLKQRQSELDAFQRKLARSSILSKTGALSRQVFDDDETSMYGAQSAVSSAQAQVAVAESAIAVAKAEALGALFSIRAAEATVARIEADIKDSTLISPRSGRVQYRIAQPGEVLAAGGKLLNMVDLSDVYMTFFLPEAAAGKVALGTEVRLVLDAAPDYVIPAVVSYVASTAQFTPKTVETQSERQKLMFRVKARVDRALLLKYQEYVKTGLPGVAWVKLDPAAQWPASMSVELFSANAVPNPQPTTTP